MEQRCSDILRRFRIKVSVDELRHIYKMRKIKLKVIGIEKPKQSWKLEQKREAELRALKYDLEYIFEKKIPLYFLDEATFSARDYKKKAWSNLNENVKIDFYRAPASIGATAIINKEGVQIYDTVVKGVKMDDHWSLLFHFRQQLGHNDEVAIYMDGLSFHHSTKTAPWMRQLNIKGIKSVGYVPFYNIVEDFWAHKKFRYRRALLAYLRTKRAQDLDLMEFVREVMEHSENIDYEKLIEKKIEELIVFTDAKRDH
jgi:hypothetical protein